MPTPRTPEVPAADVLRLLEAAIKAFQAGQDDEADRLCRAVLERAPERADAWSLRGILVRKAGRLDEAVACQRQAIALAPGFADPYNNLGNVLREMFRFEEAAQAYRGAVTADPGRREAWLGLSEALREAGKKAEALEAVERALALKPGADAWLSKGNILLDLDRGEAGIAAYRQALALDADFADAWYNLGNALRDLCLLDDSIAAYRRALALKPDFPRARSNLLFSLHAHPAQTRQSIAAEHREWQRCHGEALRQAWPAHDNPADPARPLNVGFVSADLGRHPVGYFLARVFAARDRARYRFFCYSGRRVEDDLSARLRTLADGWRSTVGVGDEALAAQIRGDGIDILVDLSGHTAGNRLPVFAMKPAPVQATWAGYVGTTGLTAMDWLISDPRETPPGEEADYVERIARLPDCYVSYEAPDYAPAVAPLPLLANGYPTFGCFNNLIKVNPQVVALWGRLLRSLPTARLVLITKQLGEAATRDRYQAMFAAEGVAERVELLGAVPHADLLGWYNRIDVALDPFPYSGGLTTLESLWMGVPVVTLGGDRFAARHSVSHLTAAGVADCIADGPESYLELARALVADGDRLAHRRAGLRQQLAASPLCDGVGFTRNLEAAFRRMWGDWCARQGRPALDRLLAEASSRFQSQDWQGCATACEQLLTLRPVAADVRTLLGLCRRRLGDRAGALACYRQAVADDPRWGDAWHNLGNLLADQGELLEAAEAYRQALASRDGRWLEPLLGLTETLRKLGRAAESAALCAEALPSHGELAGLLLNWGNALREAGQPEAAEAAYRRAAAAGAGLALPRYNLGTLLKGCGREAEARQWLEAARLLPGCPAEVDVLLAELCDHLGDMAAAVAAYGRAVAALPGRADILHNLGTLLNRQGRRAEAMVAYRQALAIDDRQAMTWANLGNGLLEQNDLPGAAEAYAAALVRNPDDLATRANLVHVRQRLCDWPALGRLREEVVLPALAWNGEGMAPAPFPFLSMPAEIDPAEQRQIAENYAASLAGKIVPLASPAPPAPGSRLRIGYVSADFHNHATAHLMLGLFRRHDRRQFEVFAYSLGADDGSEYRRRIVADCDAFVDLRPLGDRAAAERIRADGIDILVDLKGYTGSARPAIFAYRPAAIQVAYLGYPGTMGATFIDYVLTDRVVTPPDCQDHYTEKFAYLPASYQVNDSAQAVADWRPSRAECGLPEQGFVFCCFNSHYKIDALTFGHWMALLREVPASVLWLIGGNPATEANLRRWANAAGVAPERLVFAPKLPKDRHLARHCQADLFLDTYYYTAHTTASDALWAGVPVLSCPGRAFASRVSASLLLAMALPELIMADFAAYRAESLRLARDPVALAALKAKIVAQRQTAPLFDTDRFAQALDGIYLRMAALRAASEAPRLID